MYTFVSSALAKSKSPLIEFKDILPNLEIIGRGGGGDFGVIKVHHVWACEVNKIAFLKCYFAKAKCWEKIET